MDSLKIHRISRLKDLAVEFCPVQLPLQLPATGQLHIWKVDLQQAHSDATRQPSCEWLSQHERQRLARYRPGDIQNRHAVVLMALRGILSLYLGCPPLAIRYQYGRYGKPALAADFQSVGLHFNSTDSRDLALVAVAKDAQLGIDLEYLDRRIRNLRLAERICGVVERAQWQTGEEARRQLLQCWTRKEAWGKALGSGIRYTLPLIPVCVGLSWANCRIFSTQSDWQLLTLQPEDDWLVSVVTAGPIDSVQFRPWRSDLLESVNG